VVTSRPSGFYSSDRGPGEKDEIDEVPHSWSRGKRERKQLPPQKKKERQGPEYLPERREEGRADGLFSSVRKERGWACSPPWGVRKGGGGEKRCGTLLTFTPGRTKLGRKTENGGPRFDAAEGGDKKKMPTITTLILLERRERMILRGGRHPRFFLSHMREGKKG